MMTLKSFKMGILGVFICLFITLNAHAQSLSGTTWNMTVPTISAKPFNFIFGSTGNKGNVLVPDGKLADFTWAEDGKGNWSIQIVQMIEGVQKTENLHGTYSGKSGTGYFVSFKDKNQMLPLTMTKK